jgi:putative addiction module component (TIGR02574 family)
MMSYHPSRTVGVARVFPCRLHLVKVKPGINRKINLVMGTKTSQIPEDFKTLSSDDRIEYVQSLWDFIAHTPDQVPVPESHKKVLDQRLTAYKNDPDSAESWDKTRDRILKTLQAK